MHDGRIITAGRNVADAEKALIMLHGRGGTAESILSLSEQLTVEDFALFAPQATSNSWWPQSFLAVPARNEPWLTAAIKAVADVVAVIEKQGIGPEKIYFFGFSQGASLTVEFMARNARRYGGAAVFTGGLVGDKIYHENYKGNFKHTPIFIGAGGSDSRVPAERIYASVNVLKDMGADVTEKLYENMGHTINPDEFKLANTLIFTA